MNSSDLLHKLLEQADNYLINEAPIFFSTDCHLCLEIVFFPENGENKYYLNRNYRCKKIQASNINEVIVRDYDCIIMGNLYFCKYACCYASEILHSYHLVFKDMDCDEVDFEDLELTIHSFGCGPCTDLISLDYFLQNYLKKDIQDIFYFGLDKNLVTWSNIHESLKKFADKNDIFFNVLENDLFSIVFNNSVESDGVNIFIFNYVFSAMHKNLYSKAVSLKLEHKGWNECYDEINNFICNFIEFCSNILTNDCAYIIINDIPSRWPEAASLQYFDKIIYELERYSSLSFKVLTSWEKGESKNWYNEEVIFDESIKVNRDFKMKYRPKFQCSGCQLVIKVFRKEMDCDT